MVSILNLVKDQIDSDLIGHLAGATGESTKDTSGALESLVPAVLAGLVNKGSSMNGARDLMNMFDNDGLDGSLLGTLSDVFGKGGNPDPLAKLGSSVLGSLFGNNGVDKVVGTFSGKSSLSSSALGTLLRYIAPIAISAIGRYVRKNGLSASGLFEMLAGQKKELEPLLPAGFDQTLGLNPPERPAYTEERRSGGGGFLRWLPLLIAAIALFYFLPRLSGCADAAEDAAQSAGTAVSEAAGDVADVASDVAQGTANAVGDLVEGFKRFVLPGGVELDLEPGTLTYELATFLQNTDDSELPKTFVFENLNFEFGTTKTTPESKKTVDDLLAILKAFPNTEISLEGHTDNVGEPAANLELSQRRAEAIAAVLSVQGVDDSRIKTAGWGEQRPIASNETEEGRAENRRLELVLLAK